MKMDPEYKQAFKGLSTNELKTMWNELAPPRIRTPLKSVAQVEKEPSTNNSMLNYVVRECMVDDEGRMAIFCFQDTMLGRLERLAAGSLNLSHLGALVDYRSLLQRQLLALDREIDRFKTYTPEPQSELIEVERAVVVEEPIEDKDEPLIQLDVLEEPQQSTLMKNRAENVSSDPISMDLLPETAATQKHDNGEENREEEVVQSQREEENVQSPSNSILSEEVVQSPSTPKSEENVEPNYNTQHFALPAYAKVNARMESSDWETTTNNVLSTPMTIKEFVSPDEDHPTPLPTINEQKRRRLMERLQQSRATGDAEKCLIQ